MLHFTVGTRYQPFLSPKYHTTYKPINVAEKGKFCWKIYETWWVLERTVDVSVLHNHTNVDKFNKWN